MDRRRQDWLRDQESLLRHMEKIDKKVAAMEKKMH
jgi:hypothetical protein